MLGMHCSRLFLRLASRSLRLGTCGLYLDPPPHPKIAAPTGPSSQFHPAYCLDFYDSLRLRAIASGKAGK